jgi:hypothetical protein
MASTFNAAFIRGYNNSVYKNIEFMGNDFRGKCREEAQVGELEFYETLGSIYANSSDTDGGTFSSYATTPIMYPEHAKRVCAQIQADIGTTINKLEEVQALVTFESPYVQRMAEALNRQRDIQTIRGALGDATTGKLADGSESFDFANQTIPSGGIGMSVDKLIAIREKFLANGYRETDEFYVALTGKQIGDLLKDSEFTNYDFNDRKPLVDGVVYRYLGINVVQSELIPFILTAGGVNLDWDAADRPIDVDENATRACFAWVKRALLVGTNPTIKTDVDKDPYHKFNWVAYSCQGIGAVRMEEAGIQLVPCVEIP